MLAINESPKMAPGMQERSLISPYIAAGFVVGLTVVTYELLMLDWYSLKIEPVFYALGGLFLLMAVALGTRNTPATDPRLLFLVFGFFYLVLGPLGRKVSYDLSPDDVRSLAHLVSVIGTLGILASFMFWRPITQEKLKENTNMLLPKEAFSLCIIGIGVLFIGYVFFIGNYERIGGVFYALSMPKIDRMAMLSDKPGNLPYTPFFAIGTMLTCYGVLFSTFRLRSNVMWGGLLLIALTPFFAAMMVEGERTTLLKVVLPIVALVCFRYRLSFSPKLMALVIVAFIVLSLIGNLRTSVVQSLMDSSVQPISTRMQEFTPHWFMPREFSANNFSVSGSIAFDRPLLVGDSYAAGFLAWLPRSLYSGEKPLSLSDEFGARVAENVGRERRFGVGFSPLAEAYVNFGLIGPFFLMALIGSLLAWMSHQMHLGANLYIRLLFFVSLPLALFVYRAPLSGCFNFLFFNALILSPIYLFWKFFLCQPWSRGFKFSEN